jgi:hypothetical protein
LFRRFHYDGFFAFAGFWLLGLLSGAIVACLIRKDLFSLMSSVTFSKTSIVCLITFQFLPFLISALAVLMGKFQFLFVIVLTRASVLSFYGCLLYLHFGNAGWLVQPILQFSGLLAAPLFCWFCFQQISGRGSAVAKDLAICFIGILLISGTDHFILGPFWESVIKSLERFACSCWI